MDSSQMDPKSTGKENEQTNTEIKSPYLSHI